DAEITTSLLQRCGVNVRLGGSVFHVGHALRTIGQRVLEKSLRALAGFRRLCRRCFTCHCAGRPALLLGKLFAGLDGGGTAYLGELGKLGRRGVRVRSQRGERPVTGIVALVPSLPPSRGAPRSRRGSPGPPPRPFGVLVREILRRVRVCA